MAHTIDRRGFLGWAGATALVLPGPAQADEPEALDATFVLEQKLLESRVAPPVKTAAGWDPDKLLNQAAATMLWSGRTHRATPIELEYGELGEALEKRFDGICRTLWACALELDVLDEEGIADLEHTLREERWVVEEARLRFTARALENDLPMSAVKQIDHGFDRTLWRVERQGLASVRADLVGKLDKVARKRKIDWRQEARHGAELPFAVEEEPRSQLSKGSRPETEEEYLAKSKRLRTQGTAMLVGGLVWLVPPLTIFGGICFGPPLIIAGAVKLVAAKRNKKAAEALPEEATSP